ncbi:MAG TPA: TonB-dependent receptor, partial [Panacibacter sp.]|nr:TonB-dependent receptor [Panacibacter sp.]
SNKFTVTGSVNYVITDVSSPPTSTGFGSNPSNPSVFGNLLYTPTTVDLIGLPYQNPLDGSSVYYRSSNDIQHPLWTVHNSFTEDNVTRTYGNLQLKYDVLKGLSVSYRVGFDNYSEQQLYAQNKGGVFFNQGIYRTSTGTNTIWDHTIFANYNTDLNKNWNLSIDAGANSRENIYAQTGLSSTQQLVFGLLDHGNFITHKTTSEDGSDLDYTIRDQTVSIFTQAVFGYKEFLFFNAGARNSLTSTLEKSNRSLFYPGGSISFIPTSAFAGLRTKNVNYLKLRAGYATSARFPSPYSTRPSLNITTRAFVDRATNAVNVNSISDLLPNPDLQPELQTEVEVGLEGKFIDNRLSVDLTMYKRVAKDQILRRDLDPASGFTVTYINAGNLTNKGIELQLGYTVIRNDRWRWQLDALYTLNKSLVSDIPSDVKQIVIAGYSNLGNVAINGQPFGVIQGNYIQRDSKTGERLVSNTGDYLVSSDTKIIGDPNPNYKLTGISTLGYKAFSFRMQWDYTQGGDMYSSTSVNLVGRGVTKETDFDRTLPFVLPGVKEDGTKNDIQVSATEAFFDNLVGSTNDLGIYDATCIRLREVSLSYNLSEKALAKTPFGGISFTISGSNLFYYAPNFPKYVHFDPETSGFGVSSGRGLEFFTGPSSRRIGASIRVTF